VMGTVSREGGRGTGAGSGLGCCLVGCGAVGGHSLSWDLDNVEDSCSSGAFMQRHADLAAAGGKRFSIVYFSWLCLPGVRQGVRFILLGRGIVPSHGITR